MSQARLKICIVDSVVKRKARYSTHAPSLFLRFVAEAYMQRDNFTDEVDRRPSQSGRRVLALLGKESAEARELWIRGEETILTAWIRCLVYSNQY